MIKIPFFMNTKAMMNINKPKRIPIIVQTMSVQLRSGSETIGLEIPFLGRSLMLLRG